MKLSDYMNLPYSIVITPYTDDGKTYYYGRVLELDGCQSTGDTLEELNQSIKEAMELHIETLLENGWEVPVPSESQKEFSGRLLVRMPPSLHKRLYQESQREGVSLNLLAVTKLAGA